MDANLSKLLKWGIQNSSSGNADAGDANAAEASNGDDSSSPRLRSTLDPAMLNALLGGPSDADLMREAMACIRSPYHAEAQQATPADDGTPADPPPAPEPASLENRLIAFDNFEQLIENLDNANNLSPLGLWTPLLACLDDPEAQIRLFAAWCIGTAVQNNVASQERCLAMGGVEKLVRMATNDQEKRDVRKKACYGISSVARNYQPAMDVVTKELGTIQGKEAMGAKIDAADMEACDALMSQLRQEAAAGVE